MGCSHDAHAIGFAANASGRGAREALEAYGFDATALRGVAASGDGCGAVRPRERVVSRMRGLASLLRSASRNVAARPAAIGRRHSRQCGIVNASFVRQRRCDPAHAVRKLPESAGSEPAIFQEVEQERVHLLAHRLHGVKRERIAVPLIGVEDA